MGSDERWIDFYSFVGILECFRQGSQFVVCGCSVGVCTSIVWQSLDCFRVEFDRFSEFTTLEEELVRKLML